MFYSDRHVWLVDLCHFNWSLRCPDPQYFIQGVDGQIRVYLDHRSSLGGPLYFPCPDCNACVHDFYACVYMIGRILDCTRALCVPPSRVPMCDVKPSGPTKSQRKWTIR